MPRFPLAQTERPLTAPPFERWSAGPIAPIEIPSWGPTGGRCRSSCPAGRVAGRFSRWSCSSPGLLQAPHGRHHVHLRERAELGLGPLIVLVGAKPQRLAGTHPERSGAGDVVDE